MDSLMVIRIQVQATNAINQIRGLNAALAGTAAAGARASSGMGAIGAGTNNFVSRALAPATNAVNQFGSALSRAFDPQRASKTQWLGRQLTYNFSIPLGLAGVAATKWALETEAAVTRVAKVYGDNSAVWQTKVMAPDASGVIKQMTQAEAEVTALAKSFTALSDVYGVAQSDVATIGAAWAQAGATGLAVAKDTELTLKTMVLAELNATDATTALIATMAQYSLTSGEMSDALNVMNMVENTSAASFSDLLTVFKTSAGAARQAGVGIRQLAALTASLVPAAGSAATAGNGLKTIFTRLLNPTKQGIALLDKMGIKITDMSWQSQNGEQRLMTLAKSFDKLSSAQKTTVAATIGSVYQITKFDVLMEDIIKTHGRYQTALDATKSKADNLKQAQKELTMVLESNPQKVKQIWTILQNAMIDVIIPMLPLIVHFGQTIANLATKFSNLDPTLQKFITSVLLAIVVLGPLLRLISSFRILLSFVIEPLKALISLFGVLGTVAKGVGAILLAPFRLLGSAILELVSGIGSAFVWLWASIGKIFTGGISGLITVLRTVGTGILDFFLGIPGLVLLAITAVVLLFHKQLAQVWDNIVKSAQNSESAFGQIAQGIAEIWSKMVEFAIKVFNLLPEGIRNALISVVKMVSEAAIAVYKMFSYMNPFARHSPSLVESVTWGMAVIGKQYSKMSAVGQVFNEAAKDLKAFKNAASGLQVKPFADERASVAKVRPSALPAFDKSVGDVAKLTAMQKQLGVQITIQTDKVAQYQKAVDGLNDSLNKQTDILQKDQDKLSGLQDQYSKAQDTASAFASAPLKGMQQMSDAMFSNDMAAKKLQLQMADWKKAHGSIEDVNTQIANLQGTIEDLSARKSELRGKGAGSEILGPLDAQIKGLQAQQQKLANGSGSDAYSKMEKQLQGLNDEGERLNLLNSIKFDPLTRQLDKLANGQKEISYDDAVKGINKQKDAMAALTPKIKAASDAVDKQKTVVAAATRARDIAQTSLDTQNKTLQDMKTTYDELGNAIQEITTELNNIAAAADKAAAKLKNATDSQKALTASMTNFEAGAGANWPDPGGTGTGTVGREGGMGDQTAAIDKFTKDTLAKLGTAFSGDIFKPLKDKWNEFTNWWADNIAPSLTKVWNGIKGVFKNFGGIFDGVDFLTPLKEKIQPTLDWLKKVWDGLWPTLKKGFEDAIQGIKDAWASIEPTFKPFIEQIMPLLKDAWNILLGVLGAVGLAILGVVGFISGALGPAFKTIGDIVGDAIGVLEGVAQTLHGVFQVIGGLIDIVTGHWKDGWKKVGEGLKNVGIGLLKILDKIGKAIWDFIAGIAKTLWGGLKGAVSAIGGVLKSLGHDVIGGITDGMKSAWKKVSQWFKDIWNGIVNGVKAFLGIHSPSTVFADIGKAIINGLWEGVKGAAKILLDAGKWILQKLWDGITFVWNTFISWVGTIGTLIWNEIKTLATFFGTIGTNIWNWIGNAVTTAANTLGNWFGKIGTWIWDKVKKLGATIGTIGVNIWNWIGNAVTNAASTLGTWFSKIGTWIWNKVKTLTKSIAAIGTNIWNWIGNAVTTAANTLGTWFGKIGTWIWDKIKNLGKTIGTIGTNVWNWIGNAVTTAANTLGNWFGRIGTWIWDHIKKLGAAIGTIGVNIWNWIGNAVTNTAKNLGTWFSNIGTWIWDHVKGLATIIGNTGTNIFTWIKNAVTTKATELWTWFAGMGKTIWSNISTWIGDAVTWGENIVKGIIQGIGNLAHLVWDAITNIFTGKKVDGTPTKAGSNGVPGQAAGGRVRGPGGPREDKVLRRLSNGEYVVRASAVNRGKNERILNQMNYGGVDVSKLIPGFANGGKMKIASWSKTGTPAFSMPATMGEFDTEKAYKAVGKGLGETYDRGSSTDPAYLKKTSNQLNPMLNVPAGTGVARWAPLFRSALMMLNLFSDPNLAAGLHQMQTESGGNPRAINLTDINAINGVPSKGLMQVIDPTFRHYALPGFDKDIWDPLSNILASARYTVAAYGSLLNGWRGVAYRNGGLVGGRGTGRSDSNLVAASRGEFIIPADMYRKNKTAIDSIYAGGSTSTGSVYASRTNTVTGGSASTTVININGDLSFPNITSGSDANDLISSVSRMAKMGAR